MKTEKRDTVSVGKKILMIILYTVLGLIVLYLAFNLTVVLTARSSVMELEAGKQTDFQADAILVLGAGVRPNGTPSHMLEDRLLTALALYQANVCSRIIVSGDHGEDNYDEVNVMKSYLVDKGVPSEVVFMDHAGFDTYDSLYRAKAIFGAKSLILVTQRYHAYRAVYIGERAKIILVVAV